MIIPRVKRLSHAKSEKTRHLLNFCQHALISMDLTVSVLNVINAVYFPRVQKNPEVFIAHTHQDKLVDFQSEYFIQTLLEN